MNLKEPYHQVFTGDCHMPRLSSDQMTRLRTRKAKGRGPMEEGVCGKISLRSHPRDPGELSLYKPAHGVLS